MPRTLKLMILLYILIVILGISATFATFLFWGIDKGIIFAVLTFLICLFLYFRLKILVEDYRYDQCRWTSAEIKRILHDPSWLIEEPVIHHNNTSGYLGYIKVYGGPADFPHGEISIYYSDKPGRYNLYFYNNEREVKADSIESLADKATRFAVDQLQIRISQASAS